MESVSWFDAIAYANQRSIETNLPACFVMTNIMCQDGTKAGEDPKLCMNNTQNGIADAQVSLSQTPIFLCTGYRLLTHQEWVQLLLAGDEGPLYSTTETGSKLQNKGCKTDKNLDPIAWYGANSQGLPHPVAQKKPNKLGLHDMLGNVWE